MSKKYIKVEIKGESDLPLKQNESQSDWHYLGTESNQYAIGYYDFYLKKWYDQDFAELNDPDFYLIEEPETALREELLNFAMYDINNGIDESVRKEAEIWVNQYLLRDKKIYVSPKEK